MVAVAASAPPTTSLPQPDMTHGPMIPVADVSEVKDELNGKTPWEFACEWYTPDECERCLQRQKRGESDSIHPTPEDIYSREFAAWMAHQYRLAMRKGIEIGQRSRAIAASDVEALRAEIRGVKGFAGWDREDDRPADSAAAEMFNEIVQLKEELTVARETIERQQREAYDAASHLLRANPLTFGADGTIDYTLPINEIAKQAAEKIEHLRKLHGSAMESATAAEARVKALEAENEKLRKSLDLSSVFQEPKATFRTA